MPNNLSLESIVGNITSTYPILNTLCTESPLLLQKMRNGRESVSQTRLITFKKCSCAIQAVLKYCSDNQLQYRVWEGYGCIFGTYRP
jgi:hypothetical protein